MRRHLASRLVRRFHVALALGSAGVFTLAACSGGSSNSGGAGGQSATASTSTHGATTGASTSTGFETTTATSSSTGATTASSTSSSTTSSSSAGGGGGQGGAGGGLPGTEIDCADNVDNDGDTLFDCDDPDCMGTAVCSDLVINEVDYNQPGTDTAEFVEIFNAGNTTATFDNVSLKFINGGMSPAPVYGTIDLTGQTLGPHKYLVVGDPAVTVPAMVAKVDLSSVSMQNGAPDGLALYDGNSHTIIDSLAYQGAITDALIDGNTFNLVHTAATTAADRDLAPNISVIRFPNGAHTGDDSVDWTTTPVVTPGASNLLAEICNNSIDDDGDLLADCADPDCVAAPNCIEICNDGVDNNGNTQIDCQEAQCNNQSCAANGKKCSGTSCSCPGGNTETACGDGVDNDCDGLKDCADTDCTGSLLCAEICTDHVDNNGNTLVDCADPLCANLACGANGLTCSGTTCACPGGAVESNCSDGLDNDCDGLKDCLDPSCTGSVACSGGVLIFSEYVEGTGNRKAIEIYNVSGGPQDLSQCVMHRYTNGSTLSSATIALSGTLAVGSTFTICNSLGVTPTDSGGIPSGQCSITSAAINHNGNDSYDLVCNGTTVDFFGELTTGTVPPLPAVGDFAINQTLRRNCSVVSGKTMTSTMFDGTQWSTPPLAVDTFGGLGQRTCPGNP